MFGIVQQGFVHQLWGGGFAIFAQEYVFLPIDFVLFGFFTIGAFV